MSEQTRVLGVLRKIRNSCPSQNNDEAYEVLDKVRDFLPTIKDKYARGYLEGVFSTYSDEYMDIDEMIDEIIAVAKYKIWNI